MAGLSPITVSRALNNPELVRPETVAKVREAVERTGYIPNALAGGLASRRSKLVAAIVPQLYNAMFADTVQGMGDELAAHGYQLLLSFSNYSADREDELVSAILSRRPDGIILTEVGLYNGIHVLRKATETDIDWVFRKGGQIPERLLAKKRLEKAYRDSQAICSPAILAATR